MRDNAMVEFKRPGKIIIFVVDLSIFFPIACFSVEFLFFYGVCPGFRLTKQDDYFGVNFDHF